MSRDSKETNLNEKISQNTVSGNDSCEISKKLKRNYCYICKVQCTAEKNLKAHEQGKKHRKNVSLLEEKKSKNIKNKKTPRKIIFLSVSKSKNEERSKNVKNKNKKTLQKKKILAELKKNKDLAIIKKNKKNFEKKASLLPTPEPDVTNSLEPDNTNTDFSIDDKSKRKMNHLNHQKPKSGRYYVNPNFDDRYSKYQNAKYSYSNNYGNEDFQYNSRPYSNYPQWNNMHSTNIGPPPYRNYEHFGQRYEEYNSPYFSENREVDFNSWGNSSRHELFSYHDSENSEQNPNQPVKGSANVYEGAQFQSESFCSDNVTKSDSKVYLDSNSSSTETARLKVKLNDAKSNKTSVLTDAADKNESVSKLSPRNNTKCSVIKQIRSRSLSSSENLNGENGMKDKTENSVDSDSASEEQRIRKFTDSLLDTGPNRISRLIRPSNYKEKAAVNHLITKFTKSKRKENLTRKLRSNSLGSAENNEHETEDVNSSFNSLTTEESDEISIILDSKERTSEKSSHLEKNSSSLKKSNSPKVRKNMKSSLKNTNSDKQVSFDVCNLKSSVTVNLSSRKSSKKSTKSSVILPNEKYPVDQTKGNTIVINTGTGPKRKSLCSNPGNKVKKQKVGSTESPQRTDSDEVIESRNAGLSTRKNAGVSTRENADVSTRKNAGVSTRENADVSTRENADVSTRENSPVLTEKPKVTKPALTSDKVPEIKEEIIESSESNCNASCTNKNTQNVLDQSFALNSEFSVESLIQLFATGNVKVKEEFNDPVMEAIKGISSDELISACSNQPFVSTDSCTNKMPLDSNKKSSKSKAASEMANEERSDCLSPVILGSAFINENVTPVSAIDNSYSSNLTSSEYENISSTIDSTSKSTDSLSENLNLLDKTKPDLPPYLNKLIKELQEISSQEEKVKQNLCNAKSKISEYSSLLEEWKNKKKELQGEEESLRKQRNDIISLMQSAIKTNNDTAEKQDSSILAGSNVTDESMKKVKNKVSKKHNSSESNQKDNIAEKSSICITVPEKPKKIKAGSLSEMEEITILPPPVKEKPPEIIIFDDSEETTSTAKDIQNNSNDSRNELVTNVVSSSGSARFDVRNITAHTTVINCLVVFEDFLYTCSNDSTAKRFCLKDASLAVTYVHGAKNVTEIVVETVLNEALVFTSCSSRLISLFIASSGTKIKAFYPPCTVMSICKGWGNFYAGLANGSVNVYNWKYEEREVVKTESPASRIATAYQGRLHVLVILSSDGHIAIRDAETGLLIRYIKIFVKHPSWMTVYNDLAYLSSSDKVLIVLDIMTGRIEKRLYLSSYSTGLAVYEDYIFTISYSGVINCFNKDKSSDKKLYYGAGKNCLTCVHVYQNWVFTGNRKGNVSLFQFDPYSGETCEFSKCDTTYGLREDLEYHVEKDHLSKKKNSLKCHWQDCDFVYRKESDINEKMEHIKKHINARNLLL